MRHLIRMRVVAVLIAMLAAAGAVARDTGWDRNANGGRGQNGGRDKNGGSDPRGAEARGSESRAPERKTAEKEDPNAQFKLADYEDLLNRNLFSRYQKRQRGQRDPEEEARLQAIRDARDFEDRKRTFVPNYDKDHVLVGIVDRDGTIEAFVEDRHASKMVVVKAGDKLGTGTVGAISLDALDYIANGKTTKVAYGRNLEGGFSEAKPFEPVQIRKGDVPGEEGLSPEERMKRKRMREMGIPVPELKPPSQTADNRDQNQQDDQNLSPEERFRRAMERFAPDGFPAFQPPEGFVPPNFQDFANPNQNQNPNRNDAPQNNQNNQNNNDIPRRPPESPPQVRPEEANLSIEERMKRKRERELNRDRRRLFFTRKGRTH